MARALLLLAPGGAPSPALLRKGVMRSIFNQSTLSLAVGALTLLGACSSDDGSGTVVRPDAGGGGSADAAPAPPSCDPSCSPDNCQACRIEGETATCEYLCDEGLMCEMGLCKAPEEITCDPVCGACETCVVGDISGTASCVENCGANTSCEENLCVAPPPVEEVKCDPACGECQICSLVDGTAECVDTCGSDEACNAGQCVRAGFHARFAALQGPFTDGPSVTVACLDCHEDEAAEMLESPHWLWTGPTPNLEGKEGRIDIGKNNLINNFCVAVPAIEPRCTQCHAGYDYKDSSFNFEDITKMDCLVCHADPASGYAKAKKTGGQPEPAVDLQLAAQSVGVSTVKNCGNCHFKAGGGDNVKKGDIGSALASATFESDVHMGRGFTCANCHADEDHVTLGQGVHTPVTQGRLACEDCHSEAPHDDANLDDHALDVACQTCHIPAFSRQQPTKMDWNWATAGNKTRGTNGIEKDTLPDGTEVVVYDFMKGDFVWEKNVKPVYGWHNGRVDHMVLESRFVEGEGTEENPIVIARPLAGYIDDDAKIFPFKLMTGRQPAQTAERFLIAPDLFGPGGFWAGIPDAGDYTPEGVRDLWTTTLTQGAQQAGQIGAQETIAPTDWDFLNTEMYLGINHEVAPASEALGATVESCMACHGAEGLDWTELGYACDPLGDADGCGSRH